MPTIQAIVHGLEEGRARILVRIVPLFITVAAILFFFDFSVYRGLDDMQSMDNAQLARNISRGGGFTTEFIRPAALAQFNARAAKAGSSELFPARLFPAGVPRLLPDTYNAPGYPCLLAAWFKVTRPAFDEPATDSLARRQYAGDRPIPWLNQIFLLLTAGLVFIMALRLFDERVAWLALLAFLFSDIVWQYSITGLSTSVLMFLVTALLAAGLEICALGERREEDPDAPHWPAWIWLVVLAGLLGCACLTRLNLLVLLLPVGLFLALAPRAHFLFVPILVLVVLALVAPWFWHMAKVSGSPIGSNAPLLHQGADNYTGNQIYCALQPPNNERLFLDAMNKEWLGFVWHLDHAWSLLGTSPLILLFFASLLHHFRRRRVQMLHWFIVGAALCLVLANNLGITNPAEVDAWNIVVILFPVMLVVGAAFFFLLLDRLNLEVRLLNTSIAIALLALTAVPLVVSIFQAPGYFNYPPYAAVYLHSLSRTVPADQWITSDMPWASAWYSDRGSLWLPDSVKDFETIYDDYNPSHLLIFTPITVGQPMIDLFKGEEKEWIPFILSNGDTVPVSGFPLPTRANAQGIDYIIWTGGL